MAHNLEVIIFAFTVFVCKLFASRRVTFCRRRITFLPLCSNAGPASEEYKEVKMLSKKFDELFDRSMDMVRGLGGTADLGYLQHGPTW